ncbi:MAG: acyltransferase family protein [Rhodospirillales bacterium]|nr:acyltransferase family protein [Rhodospirillales bacterium]
MMVGHFLYAFRPAWFARLDPLANGDFAVFLFLVLSGFVLTPAFERAPDAVMGLMARRAVRLGLPVAAAVVLGFALRAAFHGAWSAAARLNGCAWLAAFVPLSPAHALADASGLTMLAGYAETSLFAPLAPHLMSVFASADTPIWSLHLELWGSALVLGLVWLRARRAAWWAWALALCWLLIGANALLLFAAGHVLSVLAREQGWLDTPGGVVRRRAGWGVMAAGAWIAAGHWFPGVEALHVLAAIAPALRAYTWFFWNLEIGALLVFVGVLLSAPAQRALAGPLPQFLGRLSFPIYLLHFPIMLGLGAAVFARLHPLGGAVATLGALAVGGMATFALAIGFEIAVERPAIALSRRFGRGPVAPGSGMVGASRVRLAP